MSANITGLTGADADSMAVRRKPWCGFAAVEDEPSRTLDRILPESVPLGQAEHHLVARAFEDADELLQGEADRQRTLRDIQSGSEPRTGDFPDAWGAYAGGTLYLDRLLLNPENHLELLRTLVFASGAGLAVSDADNERLAVEVTRSLRLPRPETRGETVAATIAANRGLWQDEETLSALGRVPTHVFATLLDLLSPRLYRNHLLLNDLRRRQLDLLPRLARLPGFHFDLAREALGRLFAEYQSDGDEERLAGELRALLLPELTQRVAEVLTRDLLLNRPTVELLLPGIEDTERLRQVVRKLVWEESGDDRATLTRPVEDLIEAWEQDIATCAEAYARLQTRLENAQRLASDLIEAAASAHLRALGLSPEPLEPPLRRLFSWAYQVPHLKDLDKPMLVLLAGVPRAGSSFVAKRLSRDLSIRTFFTTNQVREAIRSTFRWTYGEETAEELYPELFASPLEPPSSADPGQGGGNDLDGFYVQSLLTLQGLQGALSRLIKENSSAIIEGMHIVPGLVDASFYRRANVVTLILGYAETPEHLPAGVRDDPARMQGRTAVLKRINERVLELAHLSEMTVVHDPGSFEATMGEILHRVRDTVADRGLPPPDAQLAEVRKALADRRRGICRKTFRVEPPPVEEEDGRPLDDATLDRLPQLRATLADIGASDSERIAAALVLGRILARVHKPAALVFDMGGVLVRGHNAIFARRWANERLGIRLDDEQLARVHHRVFKVDDAPYRRTTRGEAEPRAFARHLLHEILQCRPQSDEAVIGSDDPAEQEALLQGYYDHYEEIADNTRVIGALEALGIPVYGLTNNFVDKVASIQARIPLIRNTPMVISDVARARKPHRRIFQYLVRLLQLTHGLRSQDMERVIFFDDKQTNLDGAYRHFGFYGVDYDANRGERLADTPEVREMLERTLLRETRAQVEALATAPRANGIGAALGTALDDLSRTLRELEPAETRPVPQAEPGEAKIRAYLASLGMASPAEQTPIAGFATGDGARAFIDRHRGLLLRTRESLVALRTLQYQLLSHMVNVPDGDYDEARRALAQVVLHVDEYTSPAQVQRRFLHLLFGELKWFLARYLADRHLVNRRKLERGLAGIGDYDAFKMLQRSGFRELLGDEAPEPETLSRIDAVVDHIEEGAADRTRKYVRLWGRWYIDELNEMVALMEDDSVRDLVRSLSPHAWHAFVRWLFPRIADIPHIKNLAKPTVILINGTSGTGKSTVAQHIARSLAIPIYFSTDVVCREVVRSTLDDLLGSDTTRESLPELYGSSFALPEDRERAAVAAGNGEQALIDWYYGHAMLTMIGVQGILDRLLETDNSAVIEGVPLVPGFLPERYFERLNIVWVVTSIQDRETHFARYAGRDLAGVDRGGAERYRKRFEEIRRIHDRLETLGRQAGCTVVDNTYGLGETAELALDRIENFYAARGLPIPDPDRERVGADIEARRRRIWSRRLLGREALQRRTGD